MKVLRIKPSDLALFKTFESNRSVKHLDIHSKSGDLSWLEDLPNSGLGIVGSRYPQSRSIELLEMTFQDLKQTNLVIISGFARGIDSKAHELAIQSGLRTIAILGCGIEIDYPKENRGLRDLILDSGGLLISQFERDEPPLARNFHNRNALIAGFSKAVWVVEAAEVSGTLNTATWAMRYNRDLYATSCFPGDHYYQGNLKLLSQKNPDRYPLAHPFYQAESFSSTWSEMTRQDQQRTLPFIKIPKTEIQKWVLSIKHEYGECQIQSLMNYAHSQGHTLGKFYQDFEKEVEAGYVKHYRDGRVDALL